MEAELDLDLLDLDLHTESPWAVYERLREEAPLYWDRHNKIWAVSRYDDILFVARDHTVFTSMDGNRPHLPADPSMINQDGEQHTRQRALVSKGFSPRRIAQLEEHVRRIATELIDAIANTGECDVVRDLAKPLPMRIIGEMLGYDPKDHDRLLAWTDEFVKGGCGPQYVTDEVQEAFGHFHQYHNDLVEKRRELPGDDLMSVWLGAEIDGVKLDDLQLLFEHVLLLVGGSETTRNVIGGGIEQLILHPDQRAFLAENPKAIPTAVDEMIRWVTPFVNMVRTATRDVEMHGKVIRAGEKVMMLYPAATRDPRAYPDPDVFDVRRNPDKHLIAFGYGSHFCLGANLARLELRVVMEEVLRRLPDMTMKPGAAPVRTRSSFIRGLASLPVLFTPESARAVALPSRAFSRSGKIVFGEPGDEGAPGDAEELGGLGLVASRPIERFHDAAALGGVHLALQPIDVVLPGRRHGAPAVGDPLREMLVEEDPVAEHDRAIDGVPQLADVAGPAVRPEDLDGLEWDLRHGTPELRGGGGREGAGQRLDLGATLPERRDRQRDAVETEVEILTESAARHLLLEIAVRGGDEADVDVDGRAAPDAEDRLLLQHPEQLHLDGERQVPHLVQEQRALRGRLEEPRLHLLRAREGALLVPEELALEHRLGESRGVDGDERSLRAPGAAVDLVGQDLLAGARLAQHQHGQHAVGDAVHLRIEGLHALVLEDHSSRAIAVVGGGLLLQ
jgi:cholest-4-en-3-one 26-monooxygenase